MKKILIITERTAHFQELAGELNTDKTNEVFWADSIKKAHITAIDFMDMIIIDEDVNGYSGLSIAKDMIRINALSQIVLVSTLSPEEFHTASEGLGILSSLPTRPTGKDAENLMKTLAALP
jgi:hypothetical protein